MCHTPLGKLRQENHEAWGSLGYTARACPKSTVRRRGLAGVGVSLGVAIEVKEAQARLWSPSLLPAIELFLQHLTAKHCHASLRDYSGLKV